jgi:hypothetical protein
MRVIIAGSRTVRAYETVARAVLESGINPSVVLSGGQKSWDPVERRWFGADYFGEQWAKAHGIPVERHCAHWHLYEKAAGPRRNAAMIQAADALIAVWDGESRGTADVIRRATERGIVAFVYGVDSQTSSNGA